MKFNALNRRMAVLEERAKPRMIATLADFVVWRAKWRQGILEEVEIDPVLEEGLRRFVEHSHGGENLEGYIHDVPIDIVSENVITCGG